MTKEDWIRKLTSRKFWATICAFVAGLLVYFGKSASDAEQITALIMSGASVIAYIIGEGLADAAGAKSDQVVTYLTGMDWEDEPEEKPPEE